MSPRRRGSARRIGEVETASTCRRERLEGKIQERYGLAKD
jgi:uncharacterized protein YjbJ (UPF0337 family)